MLASLLSILSVKYYFTPPFHTLTVTPVEVPRFTVFFFAGTFISWLSDQQRRAEAALRQIRSELEQKVHERTAALQATNEQLQAEIAERKRVESELVRLNRALRVRSACNQAVTRSGDEPELLEQVCRALVDIGGYRLAWIGYAQPDAERSVRPMARAGQALDYVDGINATWGEDERGQGPTGTAIRTAQPVACNEVLADPRFLPWRERARGHWLRSSVALPPRLSANLASVERLRAVGKRLGCSPGAVAIAWTLRHTALTAAIVGARRPKQVIEVVTA